MPLKKEDLLYIQRTTVGDAGNYKITSGDLLKNVDYNELQNKPPLFSGNYNDLTNKPTIGNATLNIKDSGGVSLGTFTANQNGAGTDITLPAGFSGNYNDLTNKPTIPSVGNATIKIRQGGVDKGSFTTNQGGNEVSIDLDAPNPTFSGDYNDLTNKPTIGNGTLTIKDAGGTSLGTFRANQTDGSDINLPAGFSGNYNDLSNKPNTIENANKVQIAPDGFSGLSTRPIACFGTSATPSGGSYSNLKYPEANVPLVEGDGTFYAPKEIVSPLLRGAKGTASTKVTINGVDFQNGNITSVDSITIQPNGGINGFFISDQRTLKSQGSNAMDLSSANGRYNFYVSTRTDVGISFDADTKEIKGSGGNAALKFTSTNGKYNFNLPDGSKGYQIDANSGTAGFILPADAAEPTNYDAEGEYIGPIQDRVAELMARVQAIESNEISDDATDSALLTLIADLATRVTALEGGN